MSGYPRFQRSRAFKQTRKTSGDTVCTGSTSWTDVDTGTDMTLLAAADDVIEYGINGLWSSSAVDAYLDVFTLVSSAAVNSLSSGAAPNNSHEGAGGWRGESGLTYPIGGSIWYVVQSSDVSSGYVTLRLRHRESAATNKTLYSTATNPLHLFAANLGPADPH